jgi:hypothetical protein
VMLMYLGRMKREEGQGEEKRGGEKGGEKV